MKKFKFTLHSLLQIKEALEKQRKSELAAARARKDRLSRELTDMEARLEEQRAKTCAPGGPALRPYDLAARDLGYRTLFFRMDEQRKKIRVATEECDRIRLALTEVMAERKALEKLREKQRERYKEELKRETNLVIDDFLSNQLNHQQTQVKRGRQTYGEAKV